MEDRRNVGENSCNSGDGADQTGPILDVYDDDDDDDDDDRLRKQLRASILFSPSCSTQAEQKNSISRLHEQQCSRFYQIIQLISSESEEVNQTRNGWERNSTAQHS